MQFSGARFKFELFFLQLVYSPLHKMSSAEDMAKEFEKDGGPVSDQPTWD